MAANGRGGRGVVDGVARRNPTNRRAAEGARKAAHPLPQVVLRLPGTFSSRLIKRSSDYPGAAEQILDARGGL